MIMPMSTLPCLYCDGPIPASEAERASLCPLCSRPLTVCGRFRLKALLSKSESDRVYSASDGSNSAAVRVWLAREDDWTTISEFERIGRTLQASKNRGVPQIYGYNPVSGVAKPISGPGYLHPSWSPDGKYLAVTKTTAYGTDIAILNATTGAEVTLLTNDGASWAPAWSPAGDQIAFLHENGRVVDLRLVSLTGPYGAWTPGDSVDLTQNAGLDSISHPDWYIAPADMPATTPAPAAPSAAPSGSGPATPSPS